MSTRGAPSAIDLPIGTVTFLFTDIEGSTRLVQELGAGYAELLADHGRIMRDAIRSGGGTEVGTEGDSFFAVFQNASAAVAATVQAQRALATHTWPGQADVRVRMGLHRRSRPWRRQLHRPGCPSGSAHRGGRPRWTGRAFRRHPLAHPACGASRRRPARPRCASAQGSRQPGAPLAARDHRSSG